MSDNMQTERALELKRLAFQLVSQLPADPKEALEVLHYCIDLIEKFYATEGRGAPLGADVVRLVRS